MTGGIGLETASAKKSAERSNENMKTKKISLKQL